MADRKCSNCGSAGVKASCNCGNVFYCSHICAEQHVTVHRQLHFRSLKTEIRAEENPVDAFFRGIRGLTDFEAVFKTFGEAVNDYVAAHVASVEAKKSRGTVNGFKTWEDTLKATASAARDVRKSVEDLQSMLKSVRIDPPDSTIDQRSIDVLSELLLSIARNVMLHVEEGDSPSAYSGMAAFYTELKSQNIFTDKPKTLNDKEDFMKLITHGFDEKTYRDAKKRLALAAVVRKKAKQAGKALDDQWKKELNTED